MKGKVIYAAGVDNVFCLCFILFAESFLYIKISSVFMLPAKKDESNFMLIYKTLNF